MTEAIGRQAIAKVSRRLLPVMALLYFVNFLDRINLGFAALTMNKDLGLSAYVYGLGAGIFFFGYFIFEVPSNLILERIGARLWIARIMLTWGLISAGMAFVTGETSFIVMRFLLGVAEAGFFPGMILYLTYWYPLHIAPASLLDLCWPFRSRSLLEHRYRRQSLASTVCLGLRVGSGCSLPKALPRWFFRPPCCAS